MITTLLDLAAALLIMLGLSILIGTYVPLWATLVISGVMLGVFSLLLDKAINRKGGA